MTIKSTLSIFLASIFLISCKAEIVEIDIKAKDILAAAEGEDEVVDFEAKFSNFGELDDESRAQIEALENILDKFMEITDFELETTDMGFEVTLEGEMPLTNKTVDSAYYLHASASDILEGYTLLSLKTGSDFEALSSQMQAINFMLAPDEFHPTKIKLKGKDIRVIAPATEVNGQAYLLYNEVMDGRVSMKFEGGAFDSIGAGFFIKEN